MRAQSSAVTDESFAGAIELFTNPIVIDIPQALKRPTLSSSKCLWFSPNIRLGVRTITGKGSLDVVCDEKPSLSYRSTKQSRISSQGLRRSWSVALGRIRLS